MSKTLPALVAATLICSAALAVPPPPPSSKPATAPAADPSVPKGSGDYSKMLAAAIRYKKGELSFAQLTQLVVAARLPPHPVGCAYVVSPSPVPPPGMPFDPAMMPKDWEHTFGEVAMTYWVGKLTRAEYDRLHEAAHRQLPGFPNCRGSDR